MTKTVAKRAVPSVKLSPELEGIPLWQRMKKRIEAMGWAPGWTVNIKATTDSTFGLGSREDEDRKELTIYVSMKYAENWAEEYLFHEGIASMIDSGRLGYDRGDDQAV
jgi:hypothetical protein